MLRDEQTMAREISIPTLTGSTNYDLWRLQTWLGETSFSSGIESSRRWQKKNKGKCVGELKK